MDSTVQPLHGLAGEVIAIRNGQEVELLSHPAILGEAAILASQIRTCRNNACTLRAVRTTLRLPQPPNPHTPQQGIA